MSVEAKADPGALRPVTVPAWVGLPWLMHGFSTRAGGLSTVYRSGRAESGDEPGGELNLGLTAEDSRGTVAANRRLLLQGLADSAGRCADAPALVTLRQTHSALTRRVDESNLLDLGSAPQLEGDGLMTNMPGIVLGILTADCVPVLVVDPRQRAVAAFHAGWRGTVQQIVEQGIGRMRGEFGSAPEDLLAAVGPAIGACCYTVGEEVRQQFAERFSYARELFSEAPRSEQADGSRVATHLDLAEANRRQLLAAGLRSEAVAMIGACTGCRIDRFFSHRTEHGTTGRMMAVIGICG
jgi:YfiH family protein